jgi:hypothetical protein
MDRARVPGCTHSHRDPFRRWGGIAGEAGWWGHLIQLAIVLVLLAVAWYVPEAGGPLLIVWGTALTAVFLAALADPSSSGAASNGLVLVALPLLLAGVFVTIDAFTRERS